MSKQYNKDIKRKRRAAYLKRRKVRTKAGSAGKAKKAAPAAAEAAAAS